MPVHQRHDVKFLIMVRNPYDSLASSMKFVETHGDEWSKVWGNFPKFSAEFDTLLEMLNTTRLKDAFVHNFFKSWYELKDQENVLVLHYTNVFKNPRKYLKIIADFIGIRDITEEGLNIVEKRTSIDFMRNRNEKYRYQILPSKMYILKDPKEIGGKGLIKRGGVNKTRDILTADQMSLLHQFGVNSIGRELVDLLENGFE